MVGAVSIASSADLPSALFDVLAHVAAGANGVDLTLPDGISPGERLDLVNQLAEAADTKVYVRTDGPMAVGDHTLILPWGSGRVRSGLRVIRDIGIDHAGGAPDPAAPWPGSGDGIRTLVSTVGFADLSDAALMGLASLASFRGVDAISTDRVGVVRRVVDTLAPVAPTQGVTSCR